VYGSKYQPLHTTRVLLFCCAIAAIGIALAPQRLLADNPHCAIVGGCQGRTDIGWIVTTLSTRVMPESGGVLTDSAGHVTISIPASAVAEPLDLLYASALNSPTPVALPLVALGYFSLTAIDAHSPSQDEGPADTLLPWTLAFTYTDCSGEAGCLLLGVDEASLRCQWLDPAHSEWQPVASQADVFGNRVTCNTTHLGHFALVADPLQVSGETEAPAVYLPLLRRQSEAEGALSGEVR
jgi:hypothetical protein